MAEAKLKALVVGTGFGYGPEHRIAVGVDRPLAEPTLQGEALRLQRGEPHRAIPAAEQVNQALFGEGFTVYDETEGWSWGQLSVDRYVGWMRADELRPHVEATHRLKVLRSFIFSRPDMKSPPLLAVSMNAQLTLGEVTNGFARVDGSIVRPSLPASRTARSMRTGSSR